MARRNSPGTIRWTENRRAILMYLWISPEPEHLAARIVSELGIPHASVVASLRCLKFHGYVSWREGGSKRQFGVQFNGGSTYGTLSNAHVWRITDEGKATASVLAAERERETDGMS